MKKTDLPYILFESAEMIEPYTELVEKVPKMCDGISFFPGGHGLWDYSDSDELPKILVLGQDFSTVDAYYEIMEHKTRDLDCPTWRNLLKVMNEANINPNNCFFSNVFMGLRKTKSMTGRFPGHRNKSFVERNIDFLRFQIITIQPKLIIA